MSWGRRVIERFRKTRPGRVVLRVSSAEASGQRLVLEAPHVERRPDKINLKLPRAF